jgi:hypothetical protein
MPPPPQRLFKPAAPTPGALLGPIRQRRSLPLRIPRRSVLAEAEKKDVTSGSYRRDDEKKKSFMTRCSTSSTSSTSSSSNPLLSTAAALLVSLSSSFLPPPPPCAASLLELPASRLQNTYWLVRAGESLSESQGRIETNRATSRDSERSLRWRVLCILWDSSEVRADRSCHRGSSGPVAIEAASRVQLSRPKGARRPGGRAALHGDGGSEQRRRVIGALQAPHGDDGHAQREPDRCIDQGDAACVRRGKWKKDGKRERGRAPERASER